MSEKFSNLLTPSTSSRLHLIVKPPPASDQESRIRAALGLERGPLPPVGITWLWKYYDYLSGSLRFPFEASCPEDNSVRPVPVIVSVVAMLPPSDDPRQNDSGLLCRTERRATVSEVPVVDLEVDIDHPNAQLIEDYWYWFWNWRFDPQI